LKAPSERNGPFDSLLLIGQFIYLWSIQR